MAGVSAGSMEIILSKRIARVASVGEDQSDAVAVMKEADIDISGRVPRVFPICRMEFDYVVTMGCGDVCRFIPRRNMSSGIWKIQRGNRSISSGYPG
jgi:protein-tyrosine-phosphatase